MKRFLLITAFIGGSTIALMAQKERMPFGDNSYYKVSKITTHKNTGNSNLSKDYLFYDGFEGTNYNITDNWEILRTQGFSLLDSTVATSPMWFLCTSSSFSGNGTTYIKNGSQSVAISYTADDLTWLVSKDTITIPNSSSVNLSFWLWYYSNYTNDYITHFTVVAYDVNSQVIDTIKSWGIDSISSISNQYASRIILSLDKYAGKSIRLAFLYENPNNSDRGTQLAIDDVYITDGEFTDLAIKGKPFEYTSIPSFLYDSISLNLGATVYNYGNPFTDTLNIDATNKSYFGLIDTLQIKDTLEEGEKRDLQFSKNLTLKNAGVYDVVYSLDNTDDIDFYNNADTLYFNYSESGYSTDNGVIGGFSLGIDQEFGNVYTVSSDAFIGGIQIEWPVFDNTKGFTPFQFKVCIYQLNPIDNTVEKTLYYEYVTKTAESSGVYVNYPLEEPIFCTHGFNYLVTVTQVETTPLGIGYDGNKDGAFWKVNQSTGAIERMANSTIGNVALRLTMSKLQQNPLATFTVKDDNDEVAPDIKIYIPELDSTITTNSNGVATISLTNGNYSYQIDTADFAKVKNDFKVFYQDLFFNITLAKPYWVKFQITNESAEPIPGAEILINDSTLTTDSNGVDSIQLAPDYYNYYVMATGYEKYDWGFLAHEAKDTLIEITLTAATTHSLTVEVINEKNEHLSNTEVAVFGYGWKYTDNEGKVTFTGISDPNVTVIAYKYNYWQNFDDIELVSDSTIQMELFANRYSATFYITSKGTPIPNADIIIEGIDTVTTSLTGYAIADFIPFGNNIPFTIKYNGYNTYNGTFNIEDMDVRVDVSLIPTAVEPVTIQEVGIYPNPNNGEFTVIADGKFKMFIFDITGKLVLRDDFAYGKASPNISDKPSGIYIVKIITDKGVTTKRIIKR